MMTRMRTVPNPQAYQEDESVACPRTVTRPQDHAITLVNVDNQVSFCG